MKNSIPRLFALILFVCLSISQETYGPLNWINKHFPLVKFNDINGNVYSIDSLSNKIIVFNFWFIHCKPCVAEMPELNRLVAHFKDDGVIFLAPTFNKSNDVRDFMTNHKFDYSVIADQFDFINQNMGINVFPTHMIVDKDGIIRDIAIGSSEDIFEDLRKRITVVLSEN